MTSYRRRPTTTRCPGFNEFVARYVLGVLAYLSSRVETRGRTIEELDALYARLKPAGRPSAAVATGIETKIAL